MRGWCWLFLAALTVGCPLEPLTVTGFAVSQARSGSVGSVPVPVAVPGLQAQDAAGLMAMINGTPVPIVRVGDGEVVVRVPPGLSGESARFELWRHGERIASRDIAAQLGQGVGVGASPGGSAAVTVNGLPAGTATTGPAGGVTINISVPAASGGGGPATIVTTGTTGTATTGAATSTPAPTAIPTTGSAPSPTATPTASATPPPTLVPIADQTPVPGGAGEVQGDVSF